MPFNGSGVFSRQYNWVTDSNASIPITPSRVDADSNDFASGLTNCVTRNGQSPWTANMPAGGFKLTGLIAGTSAGDSVSYDQLSTVPFQATGTGSVTRNAQDKLRGWIDAEDFGVVADWNIAGSTGTDNSTALTNAIAAAFAQKKNLRFPGGVIGFSTTIVLLNGVAYVGNGANATAATGTTLYYTGASDAIQINNASNGFTAANISIRNMLLFSKNITAGKATLADNGSSFLYLSEVAIGANAYGVIFDQSELVVMDRCTVSCANLVTAAIWCVNGPDRTGGNATGYTNNISFIDCNVGGATSLTSTVGYAIDGGISFSIERGQVTGCNIQIRPANVRNLRIAGVELEGSVTNAIKFAATRLNAVAASPTRGAIIENNFMIGGQAGSFLIDYDVAGANFTRVAYNDYQVSVGGAQPISITNTSLVEAVGNSSIDNASGTFLLPANWAGLGFGSANYVAYNNLNVTSESNTTPTWTPVLTATTTNPVIGNGTINSSFAREGPIVLLSQQITIGSTTTLGTGGWQVNLPIAESYGRPVIGTLQVNHGGSITTGSVRLPASSSTLAFYGPTAALTGASPFALANGDTIEWTLIMPTRAK